MKKKTTSPKPLAFLEELAVQQDGQYVKSNQSVDENLRALDAAIVAGGSAAGKADKVQNATEGNFAGLDANGNLTDSTKKAADFAAADHDHTSLVNGDASLDLSQAGAATVTIEGAGPAPVKGVFTVTGGTVSGTNPITGEQVSYELASTTVEIPLTQSSAPPSYRGDAVVDGVGYFVFRSAEGAGHVAQDQLSVGVPNSPVVVVYDIDNTDYANPVLTLSSMGGAFTGSVTYAQVTGSASDVVKTLATTDDVTTAVNTAVNGLDAEVTSTNGTNVQVKVTEVDGKITGVSITKDDTYKKPADGISGTDLATGCVTTTKIAPLAYIKLVDDVDDQEYIIRMHDGRLEVVADDSGGSYTPTGFPVYLSMQQISSGTSGSVAPKDFVSYLWKAYVDDIEGYLYYVNAEGSPRPANEGTYPDEFGINTLQPLDADHDYEYYPWHINWMGNFTGTPTLVCEAGCPFTADMFEVKWVDPEDIDPSDFPEEGAGSVAPNKRLPKRQ